MTFHAPPADLARYFTTFYHVIINPADGGMVQDSLHPEWANIRIFSGSGPRSTIGGQTLAAANCTLTGPSSEPLHFSIDRTELWGVGLLPLGWACFIGRPADRYANRVLDVRGTRGLEKIAQLADHVLDRIGSPEEQLASLHRFFRDAANHVGAEDPRIAAIHAILVEPELPHVSDLADRCELHPRTLERLCRKHFGFSPKRLLRRQRFMRSLAQFILDPSMGWIGAMDSLYFDQSHFVRDCKDFLGVAPSEYAAADHPVMTTFVRERMRVLGSAAQTLHPPAAG